MKVFITGGLGFIGTALTQNLVSRGHTVTAANRIVRRHDGVEGVRVIEADTTVRGSWQDDLARHDAVINLAGASVFQRWSGRKKDEILRSRIDTTRNVVEAIAAGGGKIDLYSASAVGYYGFHGDEEIDERGSRGDDFLAKVCGAWEEEAMKAEKSGSRVVLCRFGVVLGNGGGAFAQMAAMFRRHMGAVLGSGKQWFSWIHLDDLMGIFNFLFDHGRIRGPVNFTAPRSVTNRELTSAISETLKKKVLLPPAPGFTLKMILGEFGDFLLKGQRVVPAVMFKSGYDFRFTEIRSALADLLQNQSRTGGEIR